MCFTQQLKLSIGQVKQSMTRSKHSMTSFLLVTAFPLAHYANGFFHSANGNSYIEWNRNYSHAQSWKRSDK